MDFTISEEIKQIRAVFRKFIDKELLPLEKQVDETYDFPLDLKMQLINKIKDLGLYALNAPVEYGGGGIDRVGMVVLSEELGRVSWALSEVFGLAPPLLTTVETTPEQKEKYVYPAIRGEKTYCFALTEPGAGSDAGGIKTRAVRNGQTYVINGTKHFISRGAYADFAIVFAVTDPEKRARGGITGFFVDKGTPGFTVASVHKPMGMRGMGTAELVFQDCAVPAENIMGKEGGGFSFATKQFLPYGRLWIGARCVGIAERLLELSRVYAKQRMAFGRAIAEYQAIQWMLADSAVEIYAARNMAYHCAWEADQETDETDVVTKSSMVKLYATEMVGRVADRAMQIYGGIGYMADLPIEQIYRDVRALRFWEGTSEIHKRIIAKSLIKR